METEFLGWLGYQPEVKVTLAHPEDHSVTCALYRNEECNCGGNEVTKARLTAVKQVKEALGSLDQ